MVFIEDFISLSVALISAPAISSGLNPPAYVAIEAATPISGEITTVSSAADVATLLAATQISAQAAADLTDAFAQTFAPSLIWVATYDSATETPDDALDRMEAAENAFGPVGIESRTNTDNVAVGTWLAANALRKWSHPAALQSSEAGLLTSGKPAALEAAELETVALHYHSTDAESQAAAHLGLIGGFNLSTGPMALRARLSSISLPSVTSAERTLAKANDVCLLNKEARGASASQRLIDQTRAYAGTSWVSAITITYAVQRMIAALAAVSSRHAALATPFFATADGQAEAVAAVNDQLADLAANGHFAPGTVSIGGVDVPFPDGYLVEPSISGTEITLAVTMRLGQEATRINLTVVGEVT